MKKIKLKNGTKILYKPNLFAHQNKVNNNSDYVMNVEIQKNNLKDFFDFCNKNGLYAVISFGTALGAIRDKDFIKHDDDVDIVMHMEERELFLKNYNDLKSLGFEITRYDKRGLISITRGGEYMDLYFAIKENDKRVIAKAHIYPAEFFELREAIVFLGINVFVPKLYEDLFLYQYGETWTIPIKWVETEQSIKRAIIKEKIKNILPNCIVGICQDIKSRKKKKKNITKYKLYREKHTGK